MTFHPLSGAHSMILLRVGRTTGWVVNAVGDALDAVSLRVQGDLERFKAFIDTRGHETGRGKTRSEAPSIWVFAALSTSK